VPPMPIEERIRQIEGISDAAVLSVVNDNGVGMLLVAIETRDPGKFDRDEQIKAIIMPYKRPFDLMAMPAFPRTDTAKVKRHEIAAEYQKAQGIRKRREADRTGDCWEGTLAKVRAASAGHAAQRSRCRKVSLARLRRRCDTSRSEYRARR
jgi:hypothetical protein